MHEKTKHEKTKQSGMAGSVMTWTLTVSRLRSLLARAGVSPGSGSPLTRVIDEHRGDDDATGDAHPGAASPLANEAGLIDAVKCIARPEIVFAVVNSPPAVPTTSWFYGLAGEDCLARCDATAEGSLAVAWPLTRGMIALPLFGSIGLRVPAVRHELSLRVGRREFQTLIAICDIVQEDALLAFVHRSPGLRSRFDALALYGCYYRSANAPDLRWMAQRIGFVAPVDLAPSLDDLAAGLDSLAARGFLVKADEAHYTPSDRLGITISVMNDCAGFGAMMKRALLDSMSAEPAWDMRHVGVLAGTNSLWRLDFEAPRDGEARVTICDTTPAQFEDLIATHFLALEAPRRHSPARQNPLPEPRAMQTAAASCTRCGAPLDPDARFCGKCGASAAPVTKCLKCGTSVQAIDAFCGECGTPLRPT